MSDFAFKRSPSKVYWASASLEWRELSSQSPGSQDSGFSDSETNANNSKTPPKNNNTKHCDKSINLSSNYANYDKCHGSKSEKALFRVNRDLFDSKNKSTRHRNHSDRDKDEDMRNLNALSQNSNQYSKSVASLSIGALQTQTLPIIETEKCFVLPSNHTLPNFHLYNTSSTNNSTNSSANCSLNTSADLSSNSDCESELEALFDRNLMLDLHTSTPKHGNGNRRKIMHKLWTNKHNINCNNLRFDDNNGQLKQWRQELRHLYESECLTQLQTKSILCDLNTKIDKLAQTKVAKIGEILQQSTNSTSRISGELQQLVHCLEHPKNDLDLRSTLIALTSLSLQHSELIELLVHKLDIVPILLIWCEKCESPTIRTLILRCLTVMCSDTGSIRQFEKYQGLDTIADCLNDPNRPEPELGECTALLAQITAPWIQDNHYIKNLSQYSQSIVCNLCQFASTTKCCQNLLLCLAALGNITTMHQASIATMLNDQCVDVVLVAVETKGPGVSVYLLEQLAGLLANLSALKSSRDYLESKRIAHVLIFLLNHCNIAYNKDNPSIVVYRRLLQKSMIAVSRFCTSVQVAKDVVKLGGVAKLVNFCRLKQARFDSDAVLVAALATLRKLVDLCGVDVLENKDDFLELVKPKLVNSFMAYSAQNESYV